MRLCDLDPKDRFYAGVTILLYIYVEWVNCVTCSVSSIALFLKGVI